MLKSNLCDYKDVYIFIKRTITVAGAGATEAARAAVRKNKQALFPNCSSFTDCISEINNTQVDNTKCLGFFMSIDNLIKHSDNHSKTSRIITTSKSFIFKSGLLNKTNNAVATNAQIAASLKYLK